jgi:hypothetical protein
MPALPTSLASTVAPLEPVELDAGALLGGAWVAAPAVFGPAVVAALPQAASKAVAAAMPIRVVMRRVIRKYPVQIDPRVGATQASTTESRSPVSHSGLLQQGCNHTRSALAAAVVLPFSFAPILRGEWRRQRSAVSVGAMRMLRN